jgi:nucleotide-binding universal stress UspA family protein
VEKHSHPATLATNCRQCALERVRNLRLDRVLVPLDGSQASERAIQYAAMLARWNEAEVTLFHVIHPGQPFVFYRQGVVRYPDALHDRSIVLASSYLSELAGRMKATGLNVKWGVASGDPGRMIAARADGGNFGLVVMSVKVPSPLRRLFQPRTLEHVWQRTATPVLFVKERQAGDNTTPLPLTEFIVPTGKDPVSDEAVPTAAALAAAAGVRLTILAAVVRKGSLTRALSPANDDPSGDAFAVRLRGLAASLSASGMSASVETRSGIPAFAIAGRQVAAPGSWLVMASSMPSGLGRTFLGSTAEGVLRNAPGPVLVQPYTAVIERRKAAVRTYDEGSLART